MSHDHWATNGRPAGEAECPTEVLRHHGVASSYQRRATIAVGRTCVREMEACGLTAGVELDDTASCGDICREVRVVFPPDGVVPVPEFPEA
jgi:hypothetical protein